MTEFFTALTAAAWLVPNHYPPWKAAWSDAVAIAALVALLPLVALRVHAVGRVSWQLPAAALLCCATLLAQLVMGKLLYAGDALMVVLYLGLWLAAVLVGRLMAATSGSRDDSLNALAAA